MILKPEGSPCPELKVKRVLKNSLFALPEGYTEYSDESLAVIADCINKLILNDYNPLFHPDVKGVEGPHSPKGFGRVTTYAYGCTGEKYVPCMIEEFVKELRILIQERDIYVRRKIEITKDTGCKECSNSLHIYKITCRIAIKE